MVCGFYGNHCGVHVLCYEITLIRLLHVGCGFYGKKCLASWPLAAGNFKGFYIQDYKEGSVVFPLKPWMGMSCNTAKSFFWEEISHCPSSLATAYPTFSPSEQMHALLSIPVYDGIGRELLAGRVLKISIHNPLLKSAPFHVDFRCWFFLSALIFYAVYWEDLGPICVKIVSLLLFFCGADLKFTLKIPLCVHWHVDFLLKSIVCRLQAELDVDSARYSRVNIPVWQLSNVYGRLSYVLTEILVRKGIIQTLHICIGGVFMWVSALLERPR